MPLKKLTSLERKQVDIDMRELLEKTEYLNNLLNNRDLLLEEMSDCEYLIAGAAMIGGISYFHDYAYDLLSENENKRIQKPSIGCNIKWK